MSNEKTNKEWIDDNNLKIEEIKTIANNLPDYQDIQPIYATTGFCTVKLNHPTYGETMSSDYFVYGVWVLARFNSQNQANNSIFRVVNGEVEFVADVYFEEMSGVTNISSFGCIFKVEGNDIYIFKQIGDTTSATRLYYKYNIETKVLTNLNISTDWSFWSYRPMWCYNGVIVTTADSEQLKVIDPLNLKANGYYPAKNSNNYQSTPTNQFSNVLNMYLKMFKKNTTLYAGEFDQTISSYTYTGTPCFVTNDRIICLYNNGVYKCYELNLDYSLGSEVTLDCSELSGTDFLVINDKYILNSSQGKLYEYGTNGFILVQTFLSSTYYRYGTICYNNNLYIFNTGNTVVAYVYNGSYFYKSPLFIAHSENILNGVSVLNYDGTILTGSMPNNGQLNYTPSSSAQTIPAGYTSGGTISAIDYSEQGALSPEDTAEAEEQISDLFGEEE